MTRFVVVITLLLVALGVDPVRAQEEGLGPARTFFFAGAAADWTGTAIYQRASHDRGYWGPGTEKNPLINWTDNVPGKIALGAAIDVAGYWALHRLIGRRHPKLFKIGLYTAGAFRFSLMAWNLQKARDVADWPCRRIECGFSEP